MTEKLKIKLVDGRLSAKSIEEQIKEQGLVLTEEETPIRYRDLAAMSNALKLLGNRHIANRQGRIHVARCFRVIKEYLDEYLDERRQLEASKPAENIDDLTVSATIVELNREIANLGALYCPVVLPKLITQICLPENDKDHKNNEDGLAMILADLGPLYEIEPEEDDKPATND